jgi:hypothetical protein
MDRKREIQKTVRINKHLFIVSSLIFGKRLMAKEFGRGIFPSIMRALSRCHEQSDALCIMGVPPKSRGKKLVTSL